jgi:CubicO group peptidase (beta-lactamase class C family)
LKHFVVTLVVLALVSGAAHADEIDTYVRATMESEKIPGLVLAIARGGTQHVRTYGLSDLEHLVAVKPDTLFQSGSTGKQFTAAAVMLLVEDGKVRLEDPLTVHFREAPASWRRITVRHLLTHTSGLPDYGGRDGFIDLRRDYTEDQLVAAATRLQLEFEPGTQWAYSNTGYVLLGVLIHRVSGKFYGDVLKERIFKPLGMPLARVIDESGIILNRASGYVRTEAGVRNQEWVSPSLNTTADGALYLTAREYLIWVDALRRRKVVRAPALEAMWTPVRLADGTTYPYGFGWFLSEQRGFRAIEHGGAWQGFKAAVNFYPEADLVLSVMCNLDACAATEMAGAIAGLIDPKLAWPDARATPADPLPGRTTMLREVMEAWLKEQAHPSMTQRLREKPDISPRARFMRKQVAPWVNDAIAIRFIGEDEVREPSLESNGYKVARIVHLGLLGAASARGVRFYLNDRDEVLRIIPQGW